MGFKEGLVAYLYRFNSFKTLVSDYEKLKLEEPRIVKMIWRFVDGFVFLMVIIFLLKVTGVYDLLTVKPVFNLSNAEVLINNSSFINFSYFLNKPFNCSFTISL